MKTISVHEFYHDASLVDRLPEGTKLVVTAKGQPKFVVTKAGRPRMTRELAAQRAISGGKGQFDGAAFLRGLKK